MKTTSVKQFNAAIREFQKTQSASGEKLGKAEVEKALQILEKGGVSAAERTAAASVLEKAQLTKGARDVLQAFVKGSESGGGVNLADGKLSDSRRADILATFNKANLAGTIQWRAGDALPLGPRFVKVELMRERHPDGFTYSAMIPAGSVNPRFPASDPDKATHFFVMREGGFAGMRQVAGPFNIKPAAGVEDDGMSTVREMKKFLQDNDGARRTVVEAAVGRASWNKSSSSVIADVQKLPNGNFKVEVELVHWRTRAKLTEGSVVVDPHGSPVGGGRPDITTAAVGEEGGVGGGGGGTVTTQAVGEEGGDSGGGGGRVTTLAVGEEGGGGGWGGGRAVTLAIPEN